MLITFAELIIVPSIKLIANYEDKKLFLSAESTQDLCNESKLYIYRIEN